MEAPRPTLLTPQCAKPLVQKKRVVLPDITKTRQGPPRRAGELYSVKVKRAEIQRLEEAHHLEEQRMRKAEQLLEQDQLLFEKIRKENKHNLVEAIQIAQKERWCNLEKMADIKKLEKEIVSIKSDISKKEEQLKEHQMSQVFLLKLSPADWRAAQQAKDLHGSPRKASARVPKLPPIRDPKCRLSPMSTDRQTPESNPSPSYDYEEEPELYFTEPQQLLDLLTELEEQNLMMFQESKEAEEDLEYLQRTTAAIKKKMERDKEEMSSKMDIVSQTIAAEKEQAAELELKARLCNFGKSKSMEEDQMLEGLGCKVEEVYRRCVGDIQANLTTIQKLAVIESHVIQLLDNMESIPQDTLDQVEQMKDQERMMRLHMQKLEQQKEHREDRLKKAMERTQANSRKTNYRRLMPRSKPVTAMIKYSNVNVSEQDELHAYFFT